MNKYVNIQKGISLIFISEIDGCAQDNFLDAAIEAAAVKINASLRRRYKSVRSP